MNQHTTIFTSGSKSWTSSTVLGVHLLSVGGSYMLGLCSLSGRTPDRQISWSLEAARMGVLMIVLLWNLTGISTVLLSKSQSNFRVTRISWPQCFARSCVNTSICLVNRGPGVVTVFGLVSENYTQFETWCFYVKWYRVPYIFPCGNFFLVKMYWQSWFYTS